jgi:hypothetical protein
LNYKVPGNVTLLLAVETLVAASLGALATEVAFLSALVALGGGSAGTASALKSKKMTHLRQVRHARQVRHVRQVGETTTKLKLLSEIVLKRLEESKNTAIGQINYFYSLICI